VLLLGVWSFALTYLFRKNKKGKVVRIGGNSIYAIKGITFVVSNPKNRAKKWKKLLAPRTSIMEEPGICRLIIGPHTFTWMTKDAYKNYYGVHYKKPYSGKFAGLREIGLINFLTTDSEKTLRILKKSRKCVKFYDKLSKQDAVLVFAKKADGFTFTVLEMPIRKWMRERIAITGERLKIKSK